MELELATLEDIANELRKRPNEKWVLLTRNGPGDWDFAGSAPEMEQAEAACEFAHLVLQWSRKQHE